MNDWNAYVTAEELQDLLRRQLAVIIIDVRSSPEFTSGHIEGARHLPLEDLPGAARDIPKAARIVAVCNEGGGGRSEVAAGLLREQGWKSAAWLKGGFFGWREADLPRIETGAASG